jgi:hypothetical protein
MFAVCFPTAHGKQIVFVVRLVLAHGKGNAQGNGCQRGFAVRFFIGAWQTIFC